EAPTRITSPALLEAALVAELEQSSLVPIVGAIGHSRVRLRAGRAVKVRFSVHDYSAGRVLTVTQYGLLRRGTFYALTFTTLSGQLARYKPTFERSASSFRFL